MGTITSVANTSHTRSPNCSWQDADIRCKLLIKSMVCITHVHTVQSRLHGGGLPVHTESNSTDESLYSERLRVV